MAVFCLLLTVLVSNCSAADFTAVCADRTAIERVYYNHRLGTKPPFEQTMPSVFVEKLVREDLHKEEVLKNAYHLEISPAMLSAEVQRINTTTRAPDVLAELKAALNNDTNRFARTVAQPVLVERILRDRFENDDTLHTSRRQQAERIRVELMTAKTNAIRLDSLMALLKRAGSNQITEITWDLGHPPAELRDEAKELMDVQKRFGDQAQILSSPHQAGSPPRFYFDDLPEQLRQILRAQLRQSGDLSAVIEVSGGFLLYLCKEKTVTTLSVAALYIPKRSYEQWLSEQTD